MGMRAFFVACAFCLVLVTVAGADSRRAATPHIVAGQFHGECFAHSIPADSLGAEGKTKIYSVGRRLRHEHTFPWFAFGIDLMCGASDGNGREAPAVIRRGRWPFGSKADDETLALAFYFDGKKVTEYSTLDIADGDQRNVVCSVSHYRVIKYTEGFDYEEDPDGFGYTDRILFSVMTVDGRRLTFDAVTGERMSVEKVDLPDDDHDKRFLGNCWGAGDDAP